MRRGPWRIRMRAAARRALRALWAAGMLGAALPLASAPAVAEAPRPGTTAELTMLVAPDGGLELSGSLPDGIDAERLRRLLPGAEGAAALGRGTGDEPGAGARWRKALGALNVVLPRIGSARIVLCDRRISLNGQLRPGFAIRETRPALRAALGPEWRMDFALTEVPPPAALDLAWDGAGLALAGILPAGLSVRQAELALALPRAAAPPTTAGGPASGLATGAAGQPGAWARALGALGVALALHESAEARLGDGALVLSGRLRPGQKAARLAAWLAARLGPDWEVTVESAETPAAPGTLRRDPFTGLSERLVAGRWVPQHEFEPARPSCQRMTLAALAAAGKPALAFGPGESEPGPAAAPVLDRLAAVARRCALAGLRVLIGGHTDSSGEAEANRALSLARAQAVRAALGARGVPWGAMQAMGYGADRPLAPNDDAGGRVLNRRITFDWSGG